MNHKRARSVNTTSFRIDFLKKKINIKQIKGFNFFFDFFYYVVCDTIVILIIGAILLTLFLPLEIGQIIFRIFAVTTIISILTFRILYAKNPHNSNLTKIQMFLEIPYGLIYFRKSTNIIKLNCVKKVILKDYAYWKMSLKFYGECRNNKKAVRYIKKKSKRNWQSVFLLNRDLIIEFIKPTSGTLILETRGSFKEVILK